MASKELLVAVDASTRSDRLVSFACRTASALGAKVHLLYVEPVENVPPEYEKFAEREGVDAGGYNDAVGSAVLRRLEGLAKVEGVPCETDLEHGNPSSVIVRYASAPGVLMVVAGLRGLHGVQKVRSLGSVARRVVENSAVPVVVVPT
ncbi:MAG TPA: universal stress protein [Nitrososphaerales archaeon]|nr:universal stress protein [Nitrososphaerales archaeon]